MSLKLNATPEAYKAFPQKGTASNVEQMPKLIAEGRVPMNVAQLMQRRLDFRNGPAEVKTNWIDNYFDTGDAVVYHPDGRAKIVLDSQTLREMTPESQRNSGALILSEDVYKTLQGEEFEKGKLGKTGEGMSKTDVKAHPVWKVLAREQTLLDDYTDFIFAEGNQRFKYDNAMGVYPSSCGGDKPEMRAWCVNRLGYGSGAVGWDDLVSDYGRLVGIAPEALSAPGKSVRNVKAYSVEEILNETGFTDDFAPSQIKKLTNILEQRGYQIHRRK